MKKEIFKEQERKWIEIFKMDLKRKRIHWAMLCLGMFVFGAR
jgi:hypothetical protein